MSIGPSSDRFMRRDVFGAAGAADAGDGPASTLRPWAPGCAAPSEAGAIAANILKRSIDSTLYHDLSFQLIALLCLNLAPDHHCKVRNIHQQLILDLFLLW